ncbi:hypothetical protein RUM44_007380 [Polyplax serrata]|uniref:Uncharacterized protein n=1 Tax=Polyplax serrata TaxID=468196 RepID=A0ABR1B0Z6_POLSC
MLEVMNAGPTELPGSGVDSATILNCWEKSSTPLIKELERTVNFAERKCGDLMQQLNFYKEYYQKWINSERSIGPNYSKRKFKTCCKPCLGVGSSETEFDKVNQFFYTKIRNKISEMNQEITNANRQLNNKIENRGVQKSNENEEINEKILHENPLDLNTVENKICKSEPTVTAKKQEVAAPPFHLGYEGQGDIKLTEKQSSKSVPVTAQIRMDFTPSKKRSTSLQRYKLRSKSLPQGVRRKFGFGGFIEVPDSKTNLRNRNRSKSKTLLKINSHRSFKTFKSEGHVKPKLTESKSGYFCKLRRDPSKSVRSLQHRVPKPKTSASCRGSNSIMYSKDVKSESIVLRNIARSPQDRIGELPNSIDSKSATVNLCRDVVPSADNLKVPIEHSNFSPNVGKLNHLMAKPNTLIPFLKQPIPFIPCSSTSKTFNLGLNVQQVLSMIKHRRHSITLQTVIKNGMQATRSLTEKMEPAVNTLFFSHTTTSHSQMTSTLCPARACTEDTFSIVTEDIGCRSNCSLLKQTQALRSEIVTEKKMENFNSDIKLERPEDVWVVEQPDMNSRECKKSQSRCTCFPSKHCVDYHKVLRQYTGWRIPTTKTRSVTSDDYSYQRMITYPKTKLCSIPSQDNMIWTSQDQDEKNDLTKVQSDLKNLTRRYSSLEKQITERNLDDDDANAELDAMESELTVREMELKDILNFYQQLLLLKEKLKSLRVRNTNSTSQTAIHSSQSQRPKKDPLRPTPSMALTKVLRKIQGLQDKIKLIDAP